MILTIAIISLVGVGLNILGRIIGYNNDINLFLPTISVLAWWNISLPFSIVFLVVMFVIKLIDIANNK